MYSDSDLLPLSALQHFIFCPRQCALIHVEQQWVENRFTAEGRVQHERVDRPEHEFRDGIRYEYAVLLRSLRLGLIGKADLVEFCGDKVYPVEHKRGRPKPTHCDLVQLCAQALCLEEMLEIKIEEGAIFYGKPRRRLIVILNSALREETERASKDLHKLVQLGKTPSAEYERRKCSSCSLMEICMPQEFHNVSTYIKDAINEEAP